jgi:hypothetical protein
MLTVVDKPVIQYVVDEAREAGIEHLIFVTGRNKAVIEDYFDIQVELQSTLAERGSPPGPRIASSAANPVWMTRSSGVRAGVGVGGWFGTGMRLGAVAGARARAPSVILGAAAPQRAWRLATAAVTSAGRVAIGRLD